jgi:hypothetical protein
MSIHKLSAGSGYDYLTRQVAALDATEKGHVGLASYYTERGEAPGAWIGSGMAGIDGLSAGDPVTAEQMRALFGAGLHPLATQRLGQLAAAADLSDTNIRLRPGWARRSRFMPARSAHSGSRWRSELRPDGRPPDGSRTSQSLRRFGRRSVPRWRGSSSEQSMAAIRSMPARSPLPSLSSRVRTPRRLPAMT